MRRLKESCNFLASVPGLLCAEKVEEKEGEKTRNKFLRSQVFYVHKRWKRKKGKKQEINSLEANTIPSSQYNIDFGWWLAFILFCLDEQIHYKRNIWVVTASSTS